MMREPQTWMACKERRRAPCSCRTAGDREPVEHVDRARRAPTPSAAPRSASRRRRRESRSACTCRSRRRRPPGPASRPGWPCLKRQTTRTQSSTYALIAIDVCSRSVRSTGREVGLNRAADEPDRENQNGREPMQSDRDPAVTRPCVARAHRQSMIPAIAAAPRLDISEGLRCARVLVAR